VKFNLALDVLICTLYYGINLMFDFIKNIGPTEVIIIGVILIVFFGSRKIAELGKSGGEAVKEIKKIKREFKGAVEEVKKDDDKEASGPESLRPGGGVSK